MIGAVAVLDALARYWPLLVAGWLAALSGAVVLLARAGRTLSGDPRWSRCVGCQGVFVGRTALAEHIIDHHPELMPRVDA